MIKNRKEANPMTDQTWCPIGSLQKHGHNVSSLHRLTPKTETSAYTFYIFWLYPKEKMFMLSKQLGSLRLSHRSMWFFFKHSIFFLNIPFFKHSVNKKAPLFLFFCGWSHFLHGSDRLLDGLSRLIGCWDFQVRRLHPPHLGGVLCDGAIAGELSCGCDVSDHHLGPLNWILVKEIKLGCSKKILKYRTLYQHWGFTVFS